MQSAFDELVALSGAVQLTPGNHPTARFDAHVARAETRAHHGFDFAARKREVWSDDARCLVDAESVHPPIAGSAAAKAVEARGLGAWLEERPAGAPVLETMYPGYVLGTGDAIEDAMRLGVPLAVDVSHVFMQLAQGAMTDATWRRLAAYERVAEVHVSANDGARDLHACLSPSTFGIDWARERLAAGVPVVLECYMHRLSTFERQGQIALIERGAR
jgi:hypothetical protein